MKHIGLTKNDGQIIREMVRVDDISVMGREKSTVERIRGKDKFLDIKPYKYLLKLRCSLSMSFIINNCKKT